MDNSIELDAFDKERINSNINELKEKNIPYLEHMVRIPINSLTKIVSEEEIIDRLLVDYLIASSASYMINSSMFLVGDLLDKINKRYSTDSILSIEDKTLIVNMINGLYTASELEDFCKRYESVNVCLWALGFINEIDSFNKCNIDAINKIIFKYKSYGDFINASKIRSKEEILKKADLITRYYWALNEIDEEELASKLNEDVVEIQNETLEFITSYSYDSLSNRKIKIEYNKDDFHFSFEIPSELNFEKVSNSSKELFALKSEEGRSRIVATDLGKIDITNFNIIVNKNISLFIKNGFTLLAKYVLHSTFIKEKIVRIIIKKGSVSLNTYYIFVSDHLIRLDSLIEAYIDSSNYYENINSKNTSIDFDLIFSLREVK